MEKLTLTKEIRELCNSIKKKALQLNGQEIIPFYQPFLEDYKHKLFLIDKNIETILQRGVRHAND